MEIDGELTLRYTYGVVRNSVNIALTEKEASLMNLHLYTDRLGSTRFATYSTGAVLGSVGYDAWGNRAGGLDMSVMVLGETPVARGISLQNYTGHRFDDVLGLYFAQARMYDPVTRRFHAADPHWNVHNRLDGFYAMLQSANLYVYVVNNPLKYVDPLGLFLSPWERQRLSAAELAFVDDLALRWSAAYSRGDHDEMALVLAHAEAIHARIAPVNLGSGWVIAFGAEYAAALGIRVSAGVQVVVDHRGNWGFAGTLGGGAGTPDKSWSAGFTLITNADSISDLIGFSFSSGGGFRRFGIGYGLNNGVWEFTIGTTGRTQAHAVLSLTGVLQMGTLPQSIINPIAEIVDSLFPPSVISQFAEIVDSLRREHLQQEDLRTQPYFNH